VKGLVWCAILAILFSACMLTIGLASGMPSPAQALFIYGGLPGYGAAMTLTTLMYDGDSSHRAVVVFGTIYVLVNAAFFNTIFIAAWKTIAAMSRFSRGRRRI
jgi:hypothetical protein